ncbi:dnaJ homolog subfamily C member 28 isoform X2 [Anabrus simplex]|uniref:dnaJ homolog subfamily C member 28 isoform X2 n=1 Tax=Anabrus simplex TaxID=316456 RepID=UPI0035A307AD
MSIALVATGTVKTFRWVNAAKTDSYVIIFERFSRLYNTSRENDEYSGYCSLLGISPGSDQNEVREAFLKQVKKYHPDSGSPDANDEKFKEHTAPQHRQYLSYDGYGSGTPRERQKQYQKFRAVTAIQNVYNHRLSKVPQGEESGLLVRDKIHIKKNKSSSEIHRLVEDLIQESMARGDFQNLPGAGKPLPSKGNNPYVDFVTHKINEVLIESGFTPEWITLQREIKNTIHQLREALAERRACLGPVPLTAKEAHEWEGVLKKFQPQVVKLNKKINDFNLQVPILNKQMVHFILEHEANNILRNGRIKADCPSKCPDIQTDSQEAPQTIFTLLDKLFRS